jgi:hypothetical protein
MRLKDAPAGRHVDSLSLIKMSQKKTESSGFSVIWGVVQQPAADSFCAVGALLLLWRIASFAVL